MARTVEDDRGRCLDFEAPEKPGTYEYKSYLICDAYLGCDQEYDVKIVVNEGSNSSEDDDDAEVEGEN